MATPSQIIQAVTDRISNAGFPVYQGIKLDPLIDADQELPAVIVHQGKDGDRAIKTRPKLIRSMSVVVECWIETTDDTTAISEVLAYGEQVRAVVAPFDSYDVPDTLDELANSVVWENLVGYTQERNWAVAQIAITIQYGG